MLHWHRITWNLAGRECRLHGRPVWVIKPPRIRRLSFCMIRSHPRRAALAVNSGLTVFIPAESRGFISGVLEIAWFYVHADCLSACRPASWCSCKHAVTSRHLLPSSALDSDTILAFPDLVVRTLNAWWEICPLKVQCKAPLCRLYNIPTQPWSESSLFQTSLSTLMIPSAALPQKLLTATECLEVFTARLFWNSKLENQSGIPFLKTPLKKKKKKRQTDSGHKLKSI